MTKSVRKWAESWVIAAETHKAGLYEAHTARLTDSISAWNNDVFLSDYLRAASHPELETGQNTVFKTWDGKNLKFNSYKSIKFKELDRLQKDSFSNVFVFCNNFKPSDIVSFILCTLYSKARIFIF